MKKVLLWSLLIVAYWECSDRLYPPKDTQTYDFSIPEQATTLSDTLSDTIPKKPYKTFKINPAFDMGKLDPNDIGYDPDVLDTNGEREMLLD